MSEKTATGLSPNSVKSTSLSDPVPESGVRIACCFPGLVCCPHRLPCPFIAHVVRSCVCPLLQQMGHPLSPETAESLFVLHQVTGNPIYREWGWKIFQAIDTYVAVDCVFVFRSCLRTFAFGFALFPSWGPEHMHVGFAGTASSSTATAPTMTSPARGVEQRTTSLASSWQKP